MNKKIIKKIKIAEIEDKIFLARVALLISHFGYISNFLDEVTKTKTNTDNFTL